MRPHLGTELWDEFVEPANLYYKAGDRARIGREVRCVGTLDGTPCTHAVLVDLRAGAGTGLRREREVGKALKQLHLGPRAAAACDVPPLARGNSSGAAVMGRWTGRRSAVPQPVWGFRGRGTQRRVCAASMRPASRCRGCGAAVCGPRSTRTLTGRSRGAAELWLPRAWTARGCISRVSCKVSPRLRKAVRFTLCPFGGLGGFFWRLAEWLVPGAQAPS